MKSKAIVVGPWIGEFSYEMCWWAPRIRKLCREKYQDYHKVHVGYAGRDIFYSDFIDQHFFYPPETATAIGEAVGPNRAVPPATGIATKGSSAAQSFFDEVVEILKDQGYKVEFLSPEGRISRKDSFLQHPEGDYINLSPSPLIVEKFRNLFGSDFLFVLSRHRSRAVNRKHNWRRERWAAYFKRIKQETGMKLVTIKHDQIFTTDDVETIECKTVEEQMAIMKASLFCVTGSTGAAALCYFLDKDALIFFDIGNRERIHMKWQTELLSDTEKIKVYIPRPDMNGMKVDDAVKVTLAFSTKKGRQKIPAFDTEGSAPY